MAVIEDTGMDLYLISLIQGIVQGLTEYLPISSTGHLIVTGHFLGFSGPQAKMFNVVIQLGAILAVVVMYHKRFLGLLRPDTEDGFSGPRGIYLLVLTTIPASVLGFFANDFIKEFLFTPKAVSLAWAVGGLAILLVEAMPRRNKFSSLDQITPYLALGVGLFQCLSLWPGFSRSAATIMGAMFLGARRRLAAEYSFIAAVPIMIGATSFELVNGWELLSISNITSLCIGFLVAFISAWIAVKAFIQLLSRATLRPFAYYRLLIAPLILFI